MLELRSLDVEPGLCKEWIKVTFNPELLETHLDFSHNANRPSTKPNTTSKAVYSTQAANWMRRHGPPLVMDTGA